MNPAVVVDARARKKQQPRMPRLLMLTQVRWWERAHSCIVA